VKIDEAKANEVEKRLNVKLIHKALFHTSHVYVEKIKNFPAEKINHSQCRIKRK
jgi:hypothetical protein